MNSTTGSRICTCFSRISGSSPPSPWAPDSRDLPPGLRCHMCSPPRACTTDRSCVQQLLFMESYHPLALLLFKPDSTHELLISEVLLVLAVRLFFAFSLLTIKTSTHEFIQKYFPSASCRAWGNAHANKKGRVSVFAEFIV